MGKLLGLLLRQAPWKLIVAVPLGLAAALANMVVLRAVQTQIATSARSALPTIVVGAVALFGIAVVCRVVIGHFSSALIRGLAHETKTRLLLDLAGRLTTVSLADLEQLGPSRIHHILSDELRDVSQGIMMLPSLLLSAAVMLASICYLGWLSPITLALALVGVAAATGLEIVGHRGMKRTTAVSAVLQSELQRQIAGIIDGGKELRVHEARRLHFLNLELQPVAERTRLSLLRTLRWEQLHRSGGFSILWLTVGLVLFVAPRLGGAEPSTAVVVLFLMGPFSDLASAWTLVSRGSFAYERIQRVLSGLTSDALPTAAAPAFLDKISLRGVEHSYVGDRGDRFRLGPVDLSLRRGELLFLVGGNGSGKTTLAKLIVGFYAPHAGELRIDEQVVDSDEARARYRQLFSTIFSSFFVFPWMLEASPAREAEAAALLAELGLGQVVRVRDGRFVTTELSTGQKKRFALACTLLDDRPILVFDEWAADQDPVWKRLFYEELLPRLKAEGKTVVVVTHDDRYFECADRLIKLENGRVVSGHPSSNA